MICLEPAFYYYLVYNSSKVHFQALSELHVVLEYILTDYLSDRAEFGVSKKVELHQRKRV